jgi:three-Cys-motif partner protein
MNRKFFDSPSDPSKVKFEIVRKYFWSWAKIIAPRVRGNIAYIDLFSGKGVYDDGSKSIPVLIIESALRDVLIKDKLLAIFNDSNSEHTESLDAAIKRIPDISQLKQKPIILNEKIGDEFGEIFKEMNIIPSLLFVDPWGYKGITLELLKAVLKDWGCDCIFFFNYNRINMCITNPILHPRINIIFGRKRAETMKKKVRLLKPRKREECIINNLKEALKEIGGEYFLTFKFKDINGSKTSHFLIFVSKSPLAYSIMKEIMAKQSSYYVQGVPSYIYTPNPPYLNNTLFPPEPLKELEAELLVKYAGKSISFRELFENHNLDKPYIKKNYKQVLLKIESENKVKTDPSKENRRKNTMGEKVIIIFPKIIC